MERALPVEQLRRRIPVRRARTPAEARRPTTPAPQFAWPDLVGAAEHRTEKQVAAMRRLYGRIRSNTSFASTACRSLTYTVAV